MGGAVTYTGQDSAVDFLKVPVRNYSSSSGSGFTVNGGTLQVSGTDATTNNVSFYQNSTGARTNISGRGTLWCTNNFTMNAGSLWTTDNNHADTLKVGTGGAAPVDGTVTLTGGTVNIGTDANPYGVLQIAGTTDANVPILNAGSVVINLNVNMAANSNQCSTLLVGKVTGTGKANFGYNGGSTSVSLHPQGNVTTGHHWQIIFFGSRNGDVQVEPLWSKNWQPNYLEIDH